MKLALGAAQFGLSYGVANRTGKATRTELVGILELARKAGVRVLDTAIAYGEKKKNLGECGVDAFEVISKVPVIPTGVAPEDWLVPAVEGSLQRLNKGCLEGLLLHRPLQLLEPAGKAIYEALLSLKARGLVKKIGISVYSPDELGLLCSSYSLDIVQAPFNIVDRRLITSGWLDALVATGTEVHVRSIFLQGLLIMEPAERPAYFDRWSQLWRAYDQWLLDNDLTPLEACLRHALSVEGISKIVVGVDSIKQLQEILSFTGRAKLAAPDGLVLSDEQLLNPGLWVL